MAGESKTGSFEDRDYERKFQLVFDSINSVSVDKWNHSNESAQDKVLAILEGLPDDSVVHLGCCNSIPYMIVDDDLPRWSPIRLSPDRVAYDKVYASVYEQQAPIWFKGMFPDGTRVHNFILDQELYMEPLSSVIMAERLMEDSSDRPTFVKMVDVFESTMISVFDGEGDWTDMPFIEFMDERNDEPHIHSVTYDSDVYYHFPASLDLAEWFYTGKSSEFLEKLDLLSTKKNLRLMVSYIGQVKYISPPLKKHIPRQLVGSANLLPFDKLVSMRNHVRMVDMDPLFPDERILFQLRYCRAYGRYA